MNGQQPFLIDVRIDLRGTDVCMSQHFLDHTQIRSIFQQMAGKRMTQRMRMNVFTDPGDPGGFLDDLPDAFPLQWLSTIG